MSKHNKTKTEEANLTSLFHSPYLSLNTQIFEALAAAGFGDLRPAHFSVFQYIARGGSRATELAERSRITKQSIGYLVEALEKQGFIEQIPDPSDGRARLVRLTPKGESVNRLVGEVLQRIEAEWAKNLGKNKMQKLRHLLTDLAEELNS